MKFLHIADTHLGYSAYRKTNDEGINQREKDTYDVFKQFIDYAITSKPAFIVHCGDLFDAVRPTNRAITFALHQIHRLSKHNIPCIVIDGNHEHPKLRETGHIFSIFDHIEDVHAIYNESYTTVKLTINKKKVTVHAVPQCSTNEQFEKQMKKIKLDSSSHYNILMVHGSIKGIREFSMNEFNELCIPNSSLKENFHYIALGHYHKYTKVRENAWYAGSSERFSFAESREKKGFIEVEFGPHVLHRFIPFKTREMVDAKPIECSQLSSTELMKQLTKTIHDIKPEGKLIRILLNNIASHLYRSIDFQTIRSLCERCVHYEIKTNLLKDDLEKPQGTSRIGALVNEYDRFLDTEAIKEKEKMRKLGIDYLEKIIKKDEGL